MNYCFIIICPGQQGHWVNSKVQKELYDILKQFFAEYNKSHHSKKFELIPSDKNMLILKAEDTEEDYKSEEIRGGADYMYFKKFTALLKDQVHRSRNVSDYSSQIGITTRKLSSICKLYKNKSPKTIIRECLISESKRLLTKTASPIKQIAIQLGFADQYQFSKYFKTYEKISPLTYRKKHSR